MGGKVAILRERPFRLYWMGRTCSAIGDALIPVALPFAVLSVGGGAQEIGLVLAAYMCSSVLLALAGGVFSDRLSRRLVMVSCNLLGGVVETLTAVALLASAMRWWMFIISAVLLGGGTGFFGTAAIGFLPTIASSELQQANALLSLTRSAAEIAGPIGSGIIVGAAGPAWVFAVDAATFAVGASFLLILHVRESVQNEGTRFLRDLVEGWRDVRSRRWLSISLVAFGLLNLGIAPFLVLGPIVADRDLGGASAWGTIAAGGAVGGVLGALLGYRLRIGRPLLLCFALGLLAVLPPLALLPPLPVAAIVVANVAFELGLAFGSVIWVTTIQREVPEDRVSRVSSFDWAVSFLFMPVGFTLAGPLAAAIGIRATLLAAVVTIVVGAGGALLTRPIRQLRTGLPEPASGNLLGPLAQDG